MLLNILVTVVVIAFACGGVIAGARFLTLRSRGIPVVVRSLPNPDGRHWRHGVLVYGSSTARVYKLRSVRPESDLQLSRHHTEITDRRDITKREASFLEAELHVMTLLDGTKTWEVALDDAGDTALVSWLESAPSERMIRSDMRDARKRGIR
ncbi:DUF2550 domain-containing protein [Corynebacterium sp. USCH3]|uniref:DUF2550 domain-containing protein n=1 Tax=Corynebacterium sp. USCH3 TaxID=3024840 RepID=UPI0030982242